MTVLIRPVQAADEPTWRRLWQGYLSFYEKTLPEAVTAETFTRLLEDERYFALVAENNNHVVGVVHCIFHPVTGSKYDYCYLEDLFVDESARGAGIGRALIQAVYAEGDRRQCARVYWNTHKDNQTARRLYDKVASLSDFVQYRR